MSALAILTYPDERLKQACVPVREFNSSLRDVINDLEDTLCTAPGCVGIAAPQIGYALRVMLVDVSSKTNVSNHGHLIFINPEVVAWDGFNVGREGCLSVPDYTGNVIRAKRITVDAYDPQGVKIGYDMEGFEARAVQHEIDHLDGLLFLDRLVSRRNDLFKRKGYAPRG